MCASSKEDLQLHAVLGRGLRHLDEISLSEGRSPGAPYIEHFRVAQFWTARSYRICSSNRRTACEQSLRVTFPCSAQITSRHDPRENVRDLHETAIASSHGNAICADCMLTRNSVLDFVIGHIFFSKRRLAAFVFYRKVGAGSLFVRRESITRLVVVLLVALYFFKTSFSLSKEPEKSRQKGF